jgi:hypothetical protein
MNGWLKRMEIADEQIHPDFTSVNPLLAWLGQNRRDHCRLPSLKLTNNR